MTINKAQLVGYTQAYNNVAYENAGLVFNMYEVITLL